MQSFFLFFFLPPLIFRVRKPRGEANAERSPSSEIFRSKRHVSTSRAALFPLVPFPRVVIRLGTRAEVKSVSRRRVVDDVVKIFPFASFCSLSLSLEAKGGKLT